MKNRFLILSTGLAMFSMFFGSGNLVFPLMVGQMSEGHYLLASFGIFLTGVLVPFLGILAVLLFRGDQKAFFARLGKPAIFWFPFIALALMGPFGVLARCITVAHGSFRLLLPDVSLWAFSLCSCAVIFVLALRKNRIVPLLGSILTPLLLIALALIVFLGISKTAIPSAPFLSIGSWTSLKTGIVQGYQTMDLLAAFFFSTFIIKHLQKKNEDSSLSSLPIFFKSSLIGAGLLTAVYFGLVLLGSMYTTELSQIPPEEMLGFIAAKALGPFAGPVVCIAVIFACLTTAIVLTSLFSDFLKKEIAHNRLPSWVTLLTTLGIAFCISTLEFSGIMGFIGPTLSLTYPALIVMTIVNIFHKLWGLKIVRAPVAIAVLVKFLTVI